MNGRDMTADGALGFDSAEAGVPCHALQSREGREAHVCAAATIATAWGIRHRDNSRAVLVSLVDFPNGLGLCVALSSDDARLVAASLMKLAETADGRKPS